LITSKRTWAKSKGAGEGIFALSVITISKRTYKIRNIYKIVRAYKFFFLQECIILGNIIKMV